MVAGSDFCRGESRCHWEDPGIDTVDGGSDSGMIVAAKKNYRRSLYFYFTGPIIIGAYYTPRGYRESDSIV